MSDAALFHEAHRQFDEPAIGPLENEVLGAMEQHDELHRQWDNSRSDLARLYARVVSAWVFEGAVLDKHAKKPARCLWFSLAGGTARGAQHFRVVGELSAHVAADGDPALSAWSCKAIPISPVTGKDMSGKPSGAFREDQFVTLRGHVFQASFSELRGPEAMQAERDEFICMVAEAERILITRAAAAITQPTGAKGDAS